MISALTGSTGAALMTLFGRPKVDAVADKSQTATTSTIPPPPPPRGTGAGAQSLFEALLGAEPAETATNPLDDILSTLFTAFDTDGDGSLSEEELQAGLTAAQTEMAETVPTSSKSLYESLFNAMAGLDGTPDNTARRDQLSEKLLSVLEG